MKKIITVFFFILMSSASLLAPKTLSDIMHDIDNNIGTVKEWKKNVFTLLYENLENITELASPSENPTSQFFSEIVSGLIKHIFLIKHSPHLKGEFDTTAIMARYVFFIHELGLKKEKKAAWKKVVSSLRGKSIVHDFIKQIFYVVFFVIYKYGIVSELATQQYEKHLGEMEEFIKTQCSYDLYSDTIYHSLYRAYQKTWNDIYSSTYQKSFENYLQENKNNDRCIEVKVTTKLLELKVMRW